MASLDGFTTYLYNMTANDHYQAELIRHLLAIDSPEAMDAALADLLTHSEYQEISKRLQIFKLLREGVPHRKIAETLGVGIVYAATQTSLRDAGGGLRLLCPVSKNRAAV